MTNEITINPDEIRQYPDRSVTDPETIRQIALWGIQNNSNELDCKISQMMEYAGLYPHVHQPFNIKQEKSLKSFDELTDIEKVLRSLIYAIESKQHEGTFLGGTYLEHQLLIAKTFAELNGIPLASL